MAAIVEGADGFDRPHHPAKSIRPTRVAGGEVDERTSVEESRGTHPHAGELEMSLLESLGQSDIEEVALELAARDLAAFDQGGKDVLFKRTRQVANEIQDLALQHIDPAVDDAWPWPARILFQERPDLAVLFDHPSVAGGVGNRPQRQGRRGAGPLRGLFQGAQIDVEKRVSVHEEKARIESFARDRQRAGGAERDRDRKSV